MTEEDGVTTVDLVIDDLGIFLQTLHVKLYVFNAHLLVKTSDKIHVSRKILLSTTTTSTVMLLTMVVSTLHAKNLHTFNALTMLQLAETATICR